MEKFEKAGQRNNSIIQGVNVKTRNKREAIIECLKNTFGVDILVIGC